MAVKKHKKLLRGIMLTMFWGSIITACGKQTNTNIGANESTESTLPLSEVEEAGLEQQITDIVTVYTTEGITYSDKEIPVQYTEDLSLLEQMGQTDCSYAYRDGKVYYRQYHGDSFEESALWAYYQPVAGTEKEIVCMDAADEKTVLFSDKGYGNLYLIGDRFI